MGPVGRQGLSRALGDRVDGLAGLDRGVWAVAAVVAVGGSMSIFYTTSVTVALGPLSQVFGASVEEIQWVATGYLLALATVIPLAGWASERIGLRALWLLMVAAFTIASALCGVAWSASSLIAFRVVQGLCGGMIMPLGMIAVTLAAGPRRVGTAMSVIGVPMLVAPVLGPVLGGAVVDQAGWRWLFFASIPVGVLALALAWRFLPSRQTGGDLRLDWVGFVLASGGIALLTFGLARGAGGESITEPLVGLPLLAGPTLLVAFIGHARRMDAPLIDVRLFAQRRLGAAVATTFLLGVTLFGSLILLPLYLQSVRGEDALSTGLLLMAQGVGAVIMLPFAGPATDRLGGGRVALVGLSLLALGTLPLTQLGAHTPYPILLAALFVRGCGLGATMMPLRAAAYAALSADAVPRATSGLNVVQRVGGCLGVAFLTVILNGRLGGASGEQGIAGAGRAAERVADAFGHTFWWAFGLTLIALPCALVLARSEAGAAGPASPPRGGRGRGRCSAAESRMISVGRVWPSRPVACGAVRDQKRRTGGRP